MGTSVATTDRLAVWRDLIREHFVALDIETADNSPFAGQVRSTQLGHLQVSSVESITQEVDRTPGLVRRGAEDYLQVGLITRGQGYLVQDRREALLGPGDFAIYETDRTFFWGLRGDWQLLVFTWPRTAVSIDRAESQRLTARAIDGSNGLGGIVGRMLTDLVATPPMLSPAGGARLADQVSELVTTVAAEQAGNEPLAPASNDLIQQVIRYIAEHLADPELGPTEIATAHFLSTRQLHRLFAQHGTTVSQHIRWQRLERCRRELAHPCGRERSITDIAQRWGFTDSATFSRSFRREYGTSPSAYRAALCP